MFLRQDILLSTFILSFITKANWKTLEEMKVEKLPSHAQMENIDPSHRIESQMKLSCQSNKKLHFDVKLKKASWKLGLKLTHER